MVSSRIQDRKSREHQLLARVFPNLPVAMFVLIGFAVECTLLTLSPEPIYQFGWSVCCLSMVAVLWLWSTGGWILWRVARWCRYHALRGTWLRSAIVKLPCIMAIVVIAMTHAASWGLYLRSGRFANVEAMLFLFRNPPQTTWLYLTPSERTAVTVAGVVALLLLAIVPFFLAWVGRSKWNCGHARGNAGFAWRLATIALLAAVTIVVWDYSPQRRTTRINALRTGLSPVVTLASSGIERTFAAPIEPCLNVAELVPREPLDWLPPPSDETNRPSIIILAIESLRHDVVHMRHQGREVSPHLNRLARGGLQLTRAYAQSTHSDYSDVCLVSSLFPLRSRQHHYYRKSDPWPKTLIYDLLKPAGYATAIVSSQNESWGCMDQFLETENLDLFYDAKRSDHPGYVSQRDPGLIHEIAHGTFKKGCLYDSHSTDVAIQWVKQQVQRDKPFFLSMNFQASHFPYELEPGTPRPFQPSNLDADVSFMHYPVEKTTNVRNAYYNAIHACDQQLGRLIAALNQLDKLDDVILVVTGENGEAFHENGSVGHGREPIEPAIRVAAVIHAPKFVQPRVDDYPFQHVDLVPSLLGQMGWPAHPNFQGIDALAADRPAADERLLFFHVLCPAASADAVLLGGRWKLMQSHDHRQTWLFDLQTDPSESRDVSDHHPELANKLRQTLAAWRDRQLAYYHLPIYYQSYFPPMPPCPFDAADTLPIKQ